MKSNLCTSLHNLALNYNRDLSYLDKVFSPPADSPQSAFLRSAWLTASNAATIDVNFVIVEIVFVDSKVARDINRSLSLKPESFIRFKSNSFVQSFNFESFKGVRCKAELQSKYMEACQFQK